MWVSPWTTPPTHKHTHLGQKQTHRPGHFGPGTDTTLFHQIIFWWLALLPFPCHPFLQHYSSECRSWPHIFLIRILLNLASGFTDLSQILDFKKKNLWVSSVFLLNFWVMITWWGPHSFCLVLDFPFFIHCQNKNAGTYTPNCFII